MSTPSEYYNADLEIFFRKVVPGKSKVARVSDKKIKGKHDYLLLPNSLSYLKDIHAFVTGLKKNCYTDSRVVVVYYSFLWKPILNLATFAGFRKRDKIEPNWLSPGDIANIFELNGFEEITRGKRFLLPLEIKVISGFVNRFFAQLPLISKLCLTSYQIFRVIPKPRDYSVSIVIPARNEEKNVKGILKKIPKLGTSQEVIFVEGNSADNTYQAIKKEIKSFKKDKFKVYVYKQRGKGKGDAVRLGFTKAGGDILSILDADLTVDPKDLVKFYQALSEGHADFANGSRLVYPREKQAMRTLNYLANAFFSIIFTYLLGQRIKDTLCGTKVFFRRDYEKIKKVRSLFNNLDPFGDFDLLLGAAKLNLKIVEIPVRYRERIYGKTNISRFVHGWLLTKMTFIAARKIKFI